MASKETKKTADQTASPSQRKFLTVAMILGVAILGWLTGVVLSSPPFLPVKTADEMGQLKADLVDYIAEKVQQERKGSTVLDINVEPPTQEGDGMVKFPYTVSYNEATEGSEGITSSVHATAVLQHKQSAWRIVKVTTDNENITFNEGDVVSGR